MLINATTGQETFPTGVCKVYLFFCPSAQFPGQEKNIGIVAREQAPVSGISVHGYPERFNAANGYTADLGKWTRANYTVHEHVILKVFASKQFDNSRRSANQYIRMRDGAALNRIIIDTLQWSSGVFQQVTLEGRFDFLSLVEASALGVKTPDQYAHHFSRAAVNTLMRREELSPQRIAAPILTREVVTNSTGEDVVISTTRRRRALEV